MDQNFFTPLRLFLAFSVAFEHIFYFQAGYANSPFELGHTSLGYFAVNAFFIISGYLITGSAVRSETIRVFVKSRFLRIIPALFTVSFIIALVLVPLLGEVSLTQYYFTGTVWLNVLKIITFINPYPDWPGLIMPGNPFAGDLTGPIWTLRYEVLAYIGTGALLMLGWHKNKAIAIILASLASVVFALDLQTGFVTNISATLGSLLRFGSCYLYGVCAFLFARYLTLNWKYAFTAFLLGGCLVWIRFCAGELLMNVALAPLIFSIALARVAPTRWMPLKADYSYGLYIFHWPIYQLLVETFPDTPIMPLLLLVGLPLALVTAALSWRVVEKPALNLKNRSNH